MLRLLRSFPAFSFGCFIVYFCFCGLVGLEILAFPCNQFGAQEPGSNDEIVEFACTRFKAEYPIFDKVEVVSDFISMRMNCESYSFTCMEICY